MKKTSSFIGAVILSVTMSFSVSASVKPYISIKPSLTGITKTSKLTDLQNYNKIFNLKNTTQNIKNTNNSKKITNYSNDYFGLNMQLGTGWELLGEQDYSNNSSEVMVLLGNQSTQSIISILLIDAKDHPEITEDVLCNEIHNSIKAAVGNVTPIQSAVLGSNSFRYYSYSHEGINASDYFTSNGSKIYAFGFLNTSASDISKILNGTSISATQTQITPVEPTAPIQQAPPTQQVPPIETEDPFADLEAPSEDIDDYESDNIVVDNDLLYLYNNNVYKNDAYKFNITLDDNWEKPSYAEAHEFAFSDYYNELYLYSKSKDPKNELGFYVNLEKINIPITIDEVAAGVKYNLSEYSDYIYNISSTKATSLNGVPFRYFTVDLKNDYGNAIKSYIYVTIKENRAYTFSFDNITNANKELASKALKSIVIQ